VVKKASCGTIRHQKRSRNPGPHGGKLACTLRFPDYFFLVPCSIETFSTGRQIITTIDRLPAGQDKTMNRKTTYLSALTLVAASVQTITAGAQTVANSLPPEILACTDEVDMMVRLSCYDSVVIKLREAPVAAGMATVATPAPETITENGPVPEPAELSASDAGFGYDRPPDRITANVVEFRELPHGELIILLDNGQIWQQKHVDRRFKLRIGETVTVARGAVAGFHLSGDSNRSIQVKRRQ